MTDQFDTNRWRTPFNVIRNTIYMAYGYVRHMTEVVDCAVDGAQMDDERRVYFHDWITPDKDTLSCTLPDKPGIVGWLNPPYRRPGQPLFQWVEWAARQPAPVVMLLPASTGTRWFCDVVLKEASYVFFVRGRISFEKQIGVKDGRPLWKQETSPRHDNLIVTFVPPNNAVYNEAPEFHVLDAKELEGPYRG